jgi:hypothetical protein
MSLPNVKDQVCKFPRCFAPLSVDGHVYSANIWIISSLNAPLMATNSKAVFINLEQLIWNVFVHETIQLGPISISTDSPVSPFLWIIYFKVDGDSIITSSPAVCFFTDGDHQDLGVGSVSPDAVINIPENIGSVSMSVIPMPDFIEQQGFSATFGAVIVLMGDLGNITTDGIRAGHDALNQGVQDLLNEIIMTSIQNLAAPTDQDIEAAIAGSNISDQVKNAIEGQQSFCENVSSLIGGADFEINHVVARFTLDQFPNPSETRDVEIVFPGTTAVMEWRIEASITVSDPCPASAAAEILDPIFSSIGVSGVGAEQEAAMPDMQGLLDLMRDFREKKQILRNTTFNDWWNLIKVHAPELACHLGTSRELPKKIMPLVNVLAEHLKEDKKEISRHTIGQVTEVLGMLAEKSSSKLRSELRAAAALIGRMTNYTLHEAMHALATRRLKRGL